MEQRSHKKRTYDHDDLLPCKPVDMPDSSRGKCARCNKLAELGDGFCAICWDKGSNKNQVYKRPKKTKKIKRKVGRPKTVSI